MNGEPIDYFFTVTSPWSYIGHRMFLDMAEKHGGSVNFRPVDFGVVFGNSGGLPLPKRSYQRRRYRMFELQRWRDFRNLEMNVRPKHFPTDATLANTMTLLAADAGQDAGKLAEGFMRACWVDEKDAGDKATLIAIADGLDIDGAELAAAAASDAGKARADEATQEAMAANVFGAPSYVYRGEPFWGQDRLELLERALSGKAGPYSVEDPV